MPIEAIKIDDFVIIRASGNYGLKDVIEQLEENLETHKAKPCKLILDIRGSKESPPYQSLHHLAKSLSAHSGQLGFRAAYVVSDDLRYGLSRIVAGKALSAGLEIRTFRELESAQNWLRQLESLDYCRD